MSETPDPQVVREVTQWFFAGREDGIPGDCVRASVASLLDLDPAQVPHFTCQDDTRVWPLALTAFASEHGWHIDRRAINVEGEPLPEYGIAIGPSPRGVSHAVVVRHGEMVWDPHPSREGLVDVQQVIEFTRSVRPAEQPQDGVAPCAVCYCRGCAQCVNPSPPHEVCFCRKAFRAMAGKAVGEQPQDERDADTRAIDAMIMASVRGDSGAMALAFDNVRKRWIGRIAELDAREAKAGGE